MTDDTRATYKVSQRSAPHVAAILEAHPELDGSVSAAINLALANEAGRIAAAEVLRKAQVE